MPVQMDTQKQLHVIRPPGAKRWASGWRGVRRRHDARAKAGKSYPGVVPEMSAGRESNDPFRKVQPDVEGEVDFIRR